MLVIGLVSLLCSILVLPLILSALTHNPLNDISLVLILFFIESAYAGLPPIHFVFNVFAGDIVFVLLLSSSLIRLFMQPDVLTYLPTLGWFSVGLAVCISMLLGVSQYGTEAVVNVRPMFYFWTCGFYVSLFSLQPPDMLQIGKRLICCDIGLCLVVFIRWGSGAVGANDYSFVGTGAYRVATSPVAGAIAMGAIALYGAERGLNPAWRRILVMIFLTVIVFLQVRSVWLATSVTLLLLMFLPGQRFGRKLTLYLSWGAVAVVAAVLFAEAAGGISVLGAIGHSFSSATDLGQGTTYDRIAGWQVLLGRWWRAGPAVWGLGFPYGSDEARYLVNPLSGLRVLVTFSAHNMYVQSLFDLGLFGSLALWFTYATALRQTIVHLRLGSPRTLSTVMLLLLVFCVVYFIAYQANYPQGIVIGVAIARMRLVPRPSRRVVNTRSLASIDAGGAR